MLEFRSEFEQPMLAKEMFMTSMPPQSIPLNNNNHIQLRPIPKKNGHSLRDLEAIFASSDKSHLGVSYVIALSAQKFHCVLCDKEFHMNLMIGHLTGNSHRRKYCKNHFPTLSAEFEQLQNAHLDKILGELLDVVAAKVETLSACKRPVLYDSAYYKNYTAEVHTKIMNGPHVGRNTSRGLENALIKAVMKKVDEIIASELAAESEPSKDEKLAAGKMKLMSVVPHPPLIQVSNATRAFDGDHESERENMVTKIHKILLKSDAMPLVHPPEPPKIFETSETEAKFEHQSGFMQSADSNPIFSAIQQQPMNLPHYAPNPAFNFCLPREHQAHWPIAHFPGLQLDPNRGCQIIPVNCLPLPPVFITAIPDPNTNCHQWYNGQVLHPSQVYHHFHPRN